jgi:hypothetical protein
MILKFVNTYNSSRTRVIARVKTEQEAFTEINKFLKEHNYKSYYTRIWYEDNIKKYDVGSYTEFFYLELEDGEKFEYRIGEDNESNY